SARRRSVFRLDALAKHLSDGLADPCLNGFRVEPSVSVRAEAIDASVADVGHESLGLCTAAGAEVQKDRRARVAEADVARQGPGRPVLVQHRVQARRSESTEAIPVAFLGI